VQQTQGKRKLALIGAKGMLAQMLLRLAPADFEIVSLDLPEFDITDRSMVLAAMELIKPDVIVNCAAYTNVDGCESHAELALQVNGVGPGLLAEAALTLDAVLVHISTDYVFAGDSRQPYTETDATGPLSSYGRSKLAGEEAIIASGLQRYFMVRTSWLYGPDGANFVETILRLSQEREELGIVADQVGSPTFTGDLVQALFALLALDPELRPYGLYHVTNYGSCSWYDFALEIVRVGRSHDLPLKVKKIKPIRTEDYPLPAPRPAYSLLSKEKYEKITGKRLPPWQQSLERYFSLRKEG
jgi:dTDP-4-dehydrorhamnose reductase